IFVVTNANGSVNGPSAPVTRGDVLVIYGTGSGMTSGAVRTGAAAPPNSTLPASVSIGGHTISPVYSGLTAGSVGLAQVNFVVPADLPPGDGIPLRFTMNDVASQTVNVSVR